MGNKKEKKTKKKMIGNLLYKFKVDKCFFGGSYWYS